MGEYDSKTRAFVAISDTYSIQEKEKIGRLIIARIIERTLAGRDVNNQPFASYDPKYKASLVFELAGKTDNVNLKLTNNMLNSLRLIDVKTPKYIVIGIDNRTQPYAYNHNIGDTLPKREFIGINKADLQQILDANPPQKQKDFNPANTKFVKLDEKNYVSLKVNLQELLDKLDKKHMDINTDADRKRIEAIKDTIINKQEMDMPRLSTQDDDIKIGDGRHRLVAFKELGFIDIYIQTPKEYLTNMLRILQGKQELDKIPTLLKEALKGNKTQKTKKDKTLTKEEQKQLDDLVNQMLKKQGLK